MTLWDYKKNTPINSIEENTDLKTKKLLETIVVKHTCYISYLCVVGRKVKSSRQAFAIYQDPITKKNTVAMGKYFTSLHSCMLYRH